MSDVPVSQDNPVLDSAVAAIQNANAQVQGAQAQLHATQPYLTGSQPQPHMPVPSLKAGLFSGASVHNLDNQQPQTRAGARNKAIGQLAAQGAGFISTYFKRKEAEKQQALAMDIHRSLELQSGIDEASQIGSQAKTILADPNATPQAKQQAQAQLEQAQAVGQKNNKLLEALLNGKNGKDIAKAYDITFGEESKDRGINDKTQDLHYNAMQDAMKQAKLDQQKKLDGGPPKLGAPAQPNVQRMPNLQQFESQLPSRMMANPAYDAALKQYNETAKQAAVVQKNAMDLVAKYHKDETTLTKEGMREESEAQIHRMDNNAKLAIAQTALKGQLARAAATRASAYARIQSAMIARGGELIKASTDVYNQATGEIKNIDKELDDAQKLREKAAHDDTYTPEMRKTIDDSITSLKGEREQQTKLQYAANIGMSGNPQGQVLQQLILSPDYKPSVQPPTTPDGGQKKGPGLLQRGLNIIKEGKKVFDESNGQRDDEE